MFGTKEDLSQEILSHITDVSKRLARVEGELAARKEQLSLTDDIVALKKQIVELEIDKDKRQEDFDRREREVTHKVGLERKRQEFEINQAKRETSVTVREENLLADQKRFEAQMAFHKEQIKGEIDRFEGLLKELLGRLPSVSVEKSIDFSMSGNGGNGRNGE